MRRYGDNNMRANRNPLSRSRDAFTMIELLIVIVIIGLVAGISLVALRAARTFTGAAVVRQRLDDIAQCVEIYKQKYGEYPPDCTATSNAEQEKKYPIIRRHIIKRWPNTLKSAKLDQMINIAVDEMNRGPGCALLFWLAGPEEVEITNDDERRPTGVREGFYADNREPIRVPVIVSRSLLSELRELDECDTSEPRDEPIIDLTYDSDGTGGGNYNEMGLMYKNSPIIYFRAEGKDGYFGKEKHTQGNGVAAPYMKNGVWYNPDSFQLVYAGEDGDFGLDAYGANEADEDHEQHEEDYVPRDLASGDQISQADRDNITNFSNGATLDSEIE